MKPIENMPEFVIVISGGPLGSDARWFGVTPDGRVIVSPGNKPDVSRLASTLAASAHIENPSVRAAVARAVLPALRAALNVSAREAALEGEIA